jgi:hypothetical protein
MDDGDKKRDSNIPYTYYAPNILDQRQENPDAGGKRAGGAVRDVK